MSDMFDSIALINEWLDEANAGVVDDSADDVFRILKIAEETGEAASAYIGATGQNPRKGVTHEMNDVYHELADVVVTALCAIQHFTGSSYETRKIILSKLAIIMERAGIK